MLNLREYRHKHRTLAEYLTWAGLIEPTVVLQKDGSFLSVIAYRGPDTESSTREQLVSIRARVNNALRRYGEGYCLHFEAKREEAPHYPDSAWPDGATRLIDRERRDAFTAQGTVFESTYYLTVTYLPPEDSLNKLAQLVVENAPGGEESAYRTALRDFQTSMEKLTALLRQTWTFANLLADDDLLTYLHSTISTRRYRVARPDNPFYLDHQLADTPVTPGLVPRLGEHFLKVISIRSWVARTTPALLDDLNILAIPYRWTVRFLPYSKTEAQKVTESTRRKWFAKRKSIATIIREALVKEESKLENTDALKKAKDAGRALAALGEDDITMGLTTLCITVWGNTLQEAERRAIAVQEIVDGRSFVSRIETINALESWLGTLPGQAYADVRRPPISSKNLVDLIPASAIWPGLATVKHFGDAPPLLYATTRGATPFRFSNLVGDVGHFFLAGPTGAGKSAKLALMAAQFRRYQGARVIAFEQGRSMRALCRAAGGAHYDLGSTDAGSLCFQPLADIAEPAERTWAHEWLLDLIQAQGVVITPRKREDVWATLTNMAESEGFDRESLTLTTFRSLIQDDEIKDALTPFVMGGPHGALLDANQSTLSDNRMIVFEMTELFNRTSAIVPVLSYLFHALERLFDGSPTLLLLDEAWRYFDNTLFSTKIKEWLKTLRKKNVSVGFATQEIQDILKSDIAPTLIGSCPTKIYLPNDAAHTPQTSPIYEKMGLNYRQIEVIATSVPKQDYYCTSPYGNRLYSLNLTDVSLAILSPNEADHAWMDDTEIQGDEFLAALLARRLGQERADALLAA